MAVATYKSSNDRGIFSWVVILVLASTLGGCTTAYKGLGPNFFVTEPSEVKEQERKFRLEVPHFGSGYILGGKAYKSESVTPVLRDVSLEAVETLESGKGTQVAGAALLISSAFFWARAEADDKCKACLPTLFALGGIGLFTYGRIKINAGVRQYNEALESRFQVTVDVP